MIFSSYEDDGYDQSDLVKVGANYQGYRWVLTLNGR